MTAGVRKEEGDSKADRALKLRDQGLPHCLIAERIGISPNRVSYFIRRGRERAQIAAEKAGCVKIENG